MDKDTQLLRQVHPSFVQANVISSQVFTSQVFKPTPKDENKLSVYNEEKFSPQESLEHFIETPSNQSVGVVSVTVSECETENLQAYEDNNPFDGHCVIDYSEHSNSVIEKKAKKLKSIAMLRGWLYKTEKT